MEQGEAGWRQGWRGGVDVEDQQSQEAAKDIVDGAVIEVEGVEAGVVTPEEDAEQGGFAGEPGAAGEAPEQPERGEQEGVD
jgi:hypothetical protein